MIYILIEDVDIKKIEMFFSERTHTHFRILANYKGDMGSKKLYGLVVDQECFKELPIELCELGRRIYQYDIFKEDEATGECLLGLLLSLGVLWTTPTHGNEIITTLLHILECVEYGSDVTFKEIFEMSEESLSAIEYLSDDDLCEIFKKENELLEELLWEITEEFFEPLKDYLKKTPFVDLIDLEIEDIAYEWALQLAIYLNLYKEPHHLITDLWNNLEAQITSELSIELEELTNHILEHPHSYLKVAHYPNFFYNH